MSSRFKRREPLALGFARVAREEIEGALAALGAGSGEPPGGEGIHGARRRLKKLRALLRLMRQALGDDAFARANSIARDAGRALSPLRDAAVQLATLAGLIEVCEFREPERLSPLRRKIRDSDKNSDPTAVNAVIACLRGLLAGIEPPQVPDETALLRDSLRRAYRRSRNAGLTAAAEPSDVTLHLLRKRVKDLHFHILLLRRAAPQHSKRLLAKLDRLGEKLGLDHDLALLAQTIESGPTIDDAAGAVLRDQIDRRRRKLQRRVFKVARAAFAAKPSAWLKPFARGWKRWRGPS